MLTNKIYSRLTLAPDIFRGSKVHKVHTGLLLESVWDVHFAILLLGAIPGVVS